MIICRLDINKPNTTMQLEDLDSRMKNALS